MENSRPGSFHIPRWGRGDWSRVLPNIWDIAAFILVIGVIVGVVHASRGITDALPPPKTDVISLDYWNLPYYALRTTLRMFVAMAFSLIFTLIYATIAAKSRRAEMVLIPILDILQSVPILGFLTFLVPFFVGLFPGNTLGAECAAVFALFTSQAWNMTFSFYQSLSTKPSDLEEITRSLHLNGWQKFWTLEFPFAIPGLVWNMMMSMSGGWFFIVATEAITVGDTNITLPGVGAYLAEAIDKKDIAAVLATVITMLLVILAYDQIIFRPITAWAGKFRLEYSAAQRQEESWVLSIFQRSRIIEALLTPVWFVMDWITFINIRLPKFKAPGVAMSCQAQRRISFGFDLVWYVIIAVGVVWGAIETTDYLATALQWADVWQVLGFTLITLVRVLALIVIASLIWVPIGVWIGLKPKLAEVIQPIAQFMAAFPANVLFPVAVIGILTFHLDPDIWLSVLIVFGTQWYILFNVIAGASAFPNDLREVSRNLQVRGWLWWKNVILPGIFPYYFTGAITASGGSWNASIVAEYVKWGDDKVVAHGVGAYIAQATEAGNTPQVVLGVAMMSLFVSVLNRFVWRRMFRVAERRLRLD